MVFGFPTDGLEEILTPSRSFNKKRFELGLEPLTYLGYPIFVREDGHWRKRKKDKKKEKKKDKEVDELFSTIKDENDLGTEGDTVQATDGSNDQGNGKSGVVEDDQQEPTKASNDDIDEGKSTASEDDGKAMSMFHVVFIMNPPLLEHNVRIKEMFEYVVKKFSKALKYEQARSNWVWRQSEMILNMKERAKEDSLYSPLPRILFFLTKSRQEKS